METERQLLSNILGGDRDAMRRLYDRYVGYTMATALRYIPDRDKAADVVQDAFVKILTSISSFGAEVNYPVGSLDDIRVVLDDD